MNSHRMTPDELLAALERAGIKRSRSTLNAWVRQGLVREPARAGAGRGMGSYSLYEPEALGEAAAAAVLLDAGVPPAEVARIRKVATAEYDLAEALEAVGLSGAQEVDWFTFLFAVVANGGPVGIPRGFAYLAQQEGAVAPGRVSFATLRRALNIHLWLLVRDRVNAGQPVVSAQEARGYLVLRRTPQGLYRLEARW